MNFSSKLIIAGLGLCLGLAGWAAEAAELTVTVRHARSAHGIVTISVFDSKDTFLGESELASIDVAAKPGDFPVVFKDLPPGTYAVAAFHDENTSGEIDTNFLGIPTEGFGFSNGAKAFLGPPKFEDAAVRVDREAETELELSY